MRTFLTILSTILTGTYTLLNAQSGPLYVKVSVTDNTSSVNGPATAAMFFSFSGDGKDSLDMYDLGNLSAISTGRDYCSPYSTSTENEILTQFDSRYFFTAPRTISFGIYSDSAATISLSSTSLSSTPDFNSGIWNEEVGNIYIEDLSTSVMYDMFGDSVSLTVPANTTPTIGFQLHFFPALRISTINETCGGSSDGSMQISNPGSTNWTLHINGPGGMTSMTVFQSDTTINMLQPGLYSLLAFTDGMLSDSQSVTISSHSLALPSFTPGATTEGQNINIDFTNTTVNNYSWSWDMGDGNFYATQNASHSFASAGTYIVALTATDTNGCQGSTTETIQITLLPPSTPPSFSNPDTLFNSNGVGTKFPSVSARFGNVLVITEQAESTVAQVDVYTVGGSLIASQRTTAAVTEIQLPQSGCYIAIMTMSNGEVKSEKIVLGL